MEIPRRFLDVIIGVFVIFPVSVCHFRGTWDFISAVILPETEPLNHVVRYCAGALSVFTLMLAPSVRRAVENMGDVGFVICSRLFMIVHGTLHIMIIEGVWRGGDYYLGFGTYPALVSFTIVYGALLLMRSSRQVLWPPYVIRMDHRDKILILSDRFNADSWARPWNTILYVTECVIIALVLPSLTMLAWRASWAIMITYIYPDDVLKSNIVCAISGLILTLIIFLMEIPFKYVSTKLEEKFPNNKLPRIIFEDIVYFFLFVAMVLLWRGCWNLNATYLIPDPLIGGAVNAVGGLLALLLLRAYHCISCLLWGIDSGGPASGPFFSIEYRFSGDSYVKI